MTTGSLTAGLSLADTDAAIAQLETDVSALQTDTTLLDRNIRTASTVDMASDDYTLTDDEANSATIIVLNAVAGKTLTWPTSADNTRPSVQAVVTLLAGQSFIAAAESGGATAVLSPATVHYVNLLPSGIYNSDEFIQVEVRRSSNGVTVTNVVSNSFVASDTGTRMVFNNAAPQAWTIDTNANVGWPTNALLYVFAEAGSGGLTVTGEVGVTLSPASLVVAAGTGATIARDGTTDSWHRVA
jgi:hypothetical protein